MKYMALAEHDTDDARWETVVGHGRAVLTLPKTLTSEDVTDLRDWLALIVRCVERRALAARGSNEMPGGAGVGFQ